QVQLCLTKRGDCNSDSVFSAAEYTSFHGAVVQCVGTSGYDNRADFTGDQCVTAPDFALLRGNFGQGGAPPIHPRQGTQAGSTVRSANNPSSLSTPATAQDVYNPFAYAGEYTDAESGFVYLRARYYDPST